MCDYNIWNIIFDYCDFKTQINLLVSFKFLHDKLFITGLYNIDRKYLNKLSNSILQKDMFGRITKLDASCNPNITDVTQLISLKILNANYNCGIDQNGIRGLNLFKFYVDGNTKIKDVSWMKSLKILDTDDNYKILRTRR